MTELSWLVDLIVNYKLSKPVKDRVLERIKEIDSLKSQVPFIPANAKISLPQHLQGQSPSTIANFLKESGHPPPPVSHVSPVAQEPVTDMSVVVASPAAAQAMQSRQEAIGLAISGKREPGRTSPRKF